jgi:hypothetical protein
LILQHVCALHPNQYLVQRALLHFIQRTLQLMVQPPQLLVLAPPLRLLVSLVLHLVPAAHLGVQPQPLEVRVLHLVSSIGFRILSL